MDPRRYSEIKSTVKISTYTVQGRGRMEGGREGGRGGRERGEQGREGREGGRERGKEGGGRGGREEREGLIDRGKVYIEIPHS